MGDVGDGDRGVGVFGEGGGVYEAGFRGLGTGGGPALAEVDGGLLLRGETLGEEVEIAALDGGGPGGDADEGVEGVGELGADAGLLEVTVGVGELLVKEGAGFGGFGVFSSETSARGMSVAEAPWPISTTASLFLIDLL